jgi:hypothetical protein
MIATLKKVFTLAVGCDTVLTGSVLLYMGTTTGGRLSPKAVAPMLAIATATVKSFFIHALLKS